MQLRFRSTTPIPFSGPRPTARPMLYAAIAGACGVFAFAPFGWWPLQFLCLAFLFYQVGQDTSVKRSAWLGAAFGFGWGMATVHWLYISMNRFGGMPAPLAALAVCLMGCFFAAYAALATGTATWLRRRWSLPLTAFVLLVLPACWSLCEWLRGWVGTGFPWVVSGYAHNTSPLAGFAPVVGVYGIGLLAAMIAGALVLLTQRARLLAVGLIAALMLAGAGLHAIAWTHADGKPITVRLLQGNVAQDEKFNLEHVNDALKLYHDMVMDQPADLIATPETAIVQFPQQLPYDYLSRLAGFAASSHSYLMLGIPLNEGPDEYTNSTIGIAPTDTRIGYHYDKHHLVPFGEFVPTGFHWFVQLMRIPLGDFTRGAKVQAPFAVKDQAVLPNICYEDLFGEEIATQLRDAPRPASILLNVSNLAWYGESIAIAQHLQAARMRALETGRPMLRSTNTGATAVIDSRGEVTASLAPYTRGALTAQVQGMAGSTPYIALGNLGFLLLSGFALATAWMLGRKYRKNAGEVT